MSVTFLTNEDKEAIDAEILQLKNNLPENTGLTNAVKTLLMTVLKNAVFITNQSENLVALEEALKVNSGGDSTNPDEGEGENTDPVIIQMTDTLYIVSGVEVNRNASILTIM